MAFQKGQSGNPGGRPKELVGLRNLARVHTEEMLSTLVSVAKDAGASASARVMAADAVLSRGWGKPAQPIDGDGDGGPIRLTAAAALSDDELATIIAGAAKKAAKKKKSG